MGIFDRFRKKRQEDNRETNDPKKSEFLSRMANVFSEQMPREQKIRLEKQKSLQELARKLTLQLAKWWGIPRKKVFFPKVQIVGKEYKGIGTDKNVASMIPESKKSGRIIVREEYLSQEFQQYFLYFLVPVPGHHRHQIVHGIHQWAQICLLFLGLC